jgi:hypothetical protein
MPYAPKKKMEATGIQYNIDIFTIPVSNAYN